VENARGLRCELEGALRQPDSHNEWTEERGPVTDLKPRVAVEDQRSRRHAPLAISHAPSVTPLGGSDARDFLCGPLRRERDGSCSTKREPSKDREISVEPHAVEATGTKGVRPYSFFKRPNSRSTAARPR